MANKFVWSGATGANDGSSWGDAYTTLMRDWGAEGTFTPGTDYIYVRSVHAESTAGALTMTGSTAEGTTPVCRVVSCVGDTTGTSPGNLAAGASVTASGINDLFINEGIYVYGVEFYAGDDLGVGQSSIDHNCFLEQCRLELTGTNSGDNIFLNYGSGAGMVTVIKDCVLDFGNAGQTIYYRNGVLFIEGGSLAYNVTDLIDTAALGHIELFVRGFDMSVLTGIVLDFNSGNSSCLIQFSRCVLGAGATLMSGPTIDVPGQRVEFFHCQIGTDADPAYQMEIHTLEGNVLADTSRYRTGGAKDSERTNPISWDMDTTAGSWRSYPGNALVSPPITAWTDGNGSTAHTYRIAIASDATIQDDEFWIVLEGPNDAATDSKAVFQSSRVAPLTAASNLTTDSGSTWTGSGVGTKQYVEVTYTPDKPGPITVRCHLAKASDNVYVDPLIQIDP